MNGGGHFSAGLWLAFESDPDPRRRHLRSLLVPCRVFPPPNREASPRLLGGCQPNSTGARQFSDCIFLLEPESILREFGCEEIFFPRWKNPRDIQSDAGSGSPELPGA